MNVEFKYFRAELQDMDFLLPANTCSLCEDIQPLFNMRLTSLFGYVEKNEGCVDCLRNGEFYFNHCTRYGTILNNHKLVQTFPWMQKLPDNFSRENIIELAYNPMIKGMQLEYWPDCCNDFMIFIGKQGIQNTFQCGVCKSFQYHL